MEALEDGTTMERMLLAQAKQSHTPVNGSIELLPLCNMNCDMCYVRLSREEMERQGLDPAEMSGASDGQMNGSAGTGQNTGMNAQVQQDNRININTADEAQLTTLTGIGATRAQAIIAYREENGPFAAIEDIMNVQGIKEGTFAKIKDEIVVG